MTYVMRYLRALCFILISSFSVEIVWADTFADNFSSASYSNNDGSHNFSSNWVETNDSGGATSGDFRITGGELRLKDDRRYITRSMNLSAYTSVALSFDYREVGFDNNSDGVEIWLNDSDGGGWQRVSRLRGSSLNTGSYSLDISTYISSNTQIRFRTSNSLGNNDQFYIDNLLISAINPVMDHLAVSHDGVAVSCAEETVNVVAHSSGHGTFGSYTGTVTVTATNTGSGLNVGIWNLLSGSNSASFTDLGNGQAQYTFVAADNGDIALGFTYTNPSTVNFDVTDGVYSEPVADDAGLIITDPLAPAGNFRDEFSPSGQSYRDAFNNTSYSNNDGTLNWATNWIENEPPGGSGASSGDVRITSGRLELTGNNTSGGSFIKPSVERELNLSGATKATLRYSLQTTSVESNDESTVAISNDGGSTWTTLATYFDDVPSLRPFSVDITPYISSNTRIRFRIEDQSGSTCCYGPSDEILEIEDVEILVDGAYSYNNNDGTLIWAGDWQESDGDGAEQGEVSIFQDALYLFGDNSQVVTVSRALDLSAYSSATLTFDYDSIGNVDAADEVEVYAYTGMTGWSRVRTLSGNISGTASVDLSSYLSADAQIRFQVDDPSSGGGCCYDNVDELFKIDNVNVEVAAYESCVSSSVDHYEISHSSPGVTCEGSEVTINAHDASHGSFSVTSNTDITVTTSPVVDSIITSPITMLAGTSSASFYLNESDVLANIDIDVTDGTASDLDDAGSEDAAFAFLDTAFRFYANTNNTDVTPIGTQISGKPSNIAPGDQSLTLRAVRTNTDTGACEAALQGTTAIELAYECNSPTTCTASDLLSFSGVTTETISRNNNAAVTKSYISVDMEFDLNGEAPFLFNYADAGEITLHARKSVAASTPEPAFELLGQSNSFVVKPFAFHFLVADEPSATSGAGSAYRKAGESFDVTLRTVIYESGDDANNNSDLANNALTPNFGDHSSIDLDLGFSLQAPTGTGTSTGSLQGWADQSVSFNNTANQGEYLFSGLTWSEVGIISMSVDHSDYLGSGQAIAGARPNIGRFYPDHFDVAVNSGRFDSSCGDFTYIGQNFTYDLVPSLTITAKNSIGVGGTTVNYTDTNFIKLDVGDITRVFPLTDTQTGADGLALMTAATTLSAGEILSLDGAGVMTYSFDAADLYRYTKNPNAEIGPFDSNLSVVINNFNDDDGAANGALIPAVTPLSPTGSTDNSNLYGRFVMRNAYGPETDDLAMEAYTEFLAATSGQYVLNSADNCTNLFSTITLDPEGSGTEKHDAVSVGSGTSDFNYNSSLNGGEAGFLFTLPGAGNDGEIDVSIELLTLPWLQYDWGSGSLQNPPSTTATFGQYRGHDRIIYWREVQ